ncbi:MAG: glycosyltransferase [Candidatus Cloacimonadota bacterium]|nr:glycosyltransferase [Candidatus Cloacimonadota bacterium]
MTISPSSLLPFPFISMIIPAYNRADEIKEFLSSLVLQTSKEFEVIIVDDGSTDNIKEVVDSFKNQLDLRYFFQKNTGPGAARNNGMDKAKGDVFVFIDSDCTVPVDYVENLVTHLESEDFDFFGGPDTYREDFPPFLKAVNYSMTSFIGTGGTRGSSGKSVGKYYPRSFNMGIKREVYEKVGGMNSLRHGQDMDFSNRIFKAGFKAKYLPDVFVYHKRRTSFRRFFKQIFNWGVTRVNLGKLDKKMLKPVHCLPSVIVTGYFLSLIFAILFSLIAYLFLFENICLLLVGGFVLIQSSREYQSLKVGLLSVVTIFTQIFAYGIGLFVGVIKSIFQKEKFVNGFTKKYYK